MPTRKINQQTYDEVAIVAAEPIPVDIGGASVTFTGDVTVGNVTVDNTNSNPIPINDAGGSLSIDDGGGSITVDGPLTDNQLRAAAVNVAVQSTVLPSGAATSANQATGNNTLSSINDKLPVLSNGGRLAVDNSGVVQPISDNGGSLTVDDGGSSITVDGPLTNSELRASPVAVSGPATDTQLRATPLAVLTRPANASTTSIAAATQSAVLLPQNANRRGFMIDNMSEQSLYLSHVNPATAENAFKRLFPNDFIAFDQQLFTTQAIYGVWTAAIGRAAVTEFS